jgi:multiple sugar transport system ATP-binding protein
LEAALDESSKPADGPARLGIRAEQVRVTAADAVQTRGTAEVVERLGDRTLIHTRLQDGSLIVAEDSGASAVQHGEVIGLGLAGARIHLFDGKGKATHARVANG